VSFADFVDLASRRLGGGVIAASDEFFGAKEALVRPEPAEFQPHTFGAKGQVVDGWETRRRRGPREAPHPADGDYDWAIVRLGVPGVIWGVVVDTAHFTGNYPAACAVDAAAVPGHPSVAEVVGTRWTEIVPHGGLTGNSAYGFEISSEARWTHVRLRIYPDGGVARLRVHGEVVPDPALLRGLTFDLAAQEWGGVAEAASNQFYSSPRNVNAPGHAAVMGEGWETGRRRDDGHDWVRLRLAAQGLISALEIDTSHFLGNAPGWAALRGADALTSDVEDAKAWFDLLPLTPLQPDTRHRLRLPGDRSATHIRLDVYPDGGVARLRAVGTPTEAGWAALEDRFRETSGGARTP
jgi:allantoicase